MDMTTALIKQKPLEKYAEIAPDHRMREIARIAIRRGFNQEKLAQAYREATGSKYVNGSNLQRQFLRTGQAEPATVAAYARILFVAPAYLELVGGKWSDEDEIKAAKDLDVLLASEAEYLVNDYQAKIAAALSDPTVRRKALQAFAVTDYGLRIGVRDRPRRSGRLVELASMQAALLGVLDVQTLLRPRTEGDGLLMDAYYALTMSLTHADTVSMLHVICAALNLKGGYNTEAMWSIAEADIAGLRRLASIHREGR